MRILIDKTIEKQVRNAIETGGAYLVMGNEGDGKTFAVSRIAQTDQSEAGNVLRVEPHKNHIGIDQIHQLNKQLRLTGVGTAERVIIVKSAEKMTTEAQNAFLKTLEEPPPSSTIILTSNNPQGLLPTVRSRLKVIKYKSTSPKQLIDYLEETKGLSNQRATSIAAISEGKVGLASRLIADPDLLKAKEKSQALVEKLFLPTTTVYEKLAAMDYDNKYVDAELIIRGVSEKIKSEMKSNAESGDTLKLKKLARWMKQLQQLLDYINSNGNDKLALTQLVLGAENV